jgi:fatty-acid desaturase
MSQTTYYALIWAVLCWASVATYVSVILHRCLSHRAILMPQWFIHLVTVWTNTFIMYVNPRTWVAEHRLHHAYSDTEDDPDKKPDWSLWKFTWWSLANPAGSNDEHVVKITKDRELNTWVMKLYSNARFGLFCQLVTGFILPYALMGSFWKAMCCWWGVRIGGICVKMIQGYFAHKVVYGYRNFETSDQSTNINGLIPAFLSAGESLQNNHHARPTSATHAFKAGERDFGYILVWVYNKIGLATFPQKSTVTPVPEISTAAA